MEEVTGSSPVGSTKKNMTEFDPKNRGDISKPEPLDVTEQFLQMSLSEFRDFLDNHWREHNDAKVVIEVSTATLSGPQKTFLSQLRRDGRVKIARQNE